MPDIRTPSSSSTSGRRPDAGRPPSVGHRLRTLALLAAGGLAGGAQATLVWTWDYTGAGITASGTFETGDLPDASGAYTIVAIQGQRNGEAIIGLQATGTAIPGNAPYTVDNLLWLTGGQLTHYGFGYQTASGLYANPYLADWLAVPQVFEVLTSPPYAGMTHELAVSFQATPAVPEPGTLALAGLALGLMAGLRRTRAAA